ncbi:MAG: hypothetical protein ACQEXV_16845 [Bacillota bacterium]
MLEFLTWAVGGVLFILSGMHVYWAVGGKRGSKAAIPSTGTALLFEPSKTGATSVLANCFLTLGGTLDGIITFDNASV